MKRFRFLCPGLCASLLAAIVGCAAPAESEPPAAARARASVLLVGVDGMEWNVVLPLLRESRLPNIAALMERGSYGLLATTEPTKSPIIWTSIATGVVESKHGVHGFTHSDDDAKKHSALYASVDRTAKAFWNILTDYDRRVGVVGWWLTYPAEVVNGVMVAQTNTNSIAEIRAGEGLWRGSLEQGVPRQVYPPDRQEEFLAVVPEVEAGLPELTRRVFGDIEQGMGPVPASLWENCLWGFRADATYRRIAVRLLEEDPAPELLAVYFGGTDILGHRYWRYYEPQRYVHPPTDEEVAKYGGVIPDYYVEIDRFLGELLAAARDDVNVIIVSDHGMAPNYLAREFHDGDKIQELRSAGHRNAPPGVIIAAGPDIARMEMSVPVTELTRNNVPELGSVLDVTPTVLELFAIPVGRDMDGEVLTDLLTPEFLDAHPVSWVESHTTAEWLEARSDEAVPGIDDDKRMEQLRALGYIE